MKGLFRLFLITAVVEFSQIVIAMESDNRVEEQSSRAARGEGVNNNNTQEFDDREVDINSSYILFQSAASTNFKDDHQARLVATSLVIKKGQKEGAAQTLHMQTDELLATIERLEDEKHRLERECDEKRKMLEFQKAQINGAHEGEIKVARSKEAEATAQLIAALERKIAELALGIQQTKAQKDTVGQDYLKTVESREKTVAQLSRAAQENPALLAKPVLEEVSAVERERRALQQAEQEEAQRQRAAQKSWWSCIIA